MTDLVHADKLRYFADNLKEDWSEVECEGGPDGEYPAKSRTLLQWMQAPDAKLINYDRLTVQGGKDSGKMCNIGRYFKVHGLRSARKCYPL